MDPLFTDDDAKVLMKALAVVGVFALVLGIVLHF
jgi:hypothetical protein